MNTDYFISCIFQGLGPTNANFTNMFPHITNYPFNRLMEQFLRSLGSAEFFSFTDV